MKLSLASTLLLSYPLGYNLAAAQVCGVNPLSEEGRTPDLSMPNGSSCAGKTEMECLNDPDCFPFGGSSQFPQNCANDIPIIWTSGNIRTTAVLQEQASTLPGVNGEAFAFGSYTNADCLPASALSCVDRSLDGEVAVLFAVEKGPTNLFVNVETILDKSEYVSTIAFPISAYAPEPLKNCIIDTAATSFALPVDAADEHIVAVLLKPEPGINPWGDIVRANIDAFNPLPSDPGTGGGTTPGTGGTPPSSGGTGPNTGDSPPPPVSGGNGVLAPGMGPNNPAGTPPSVVCPMNEEVAVEQDCMLDNTGVCLYNYHYHGCTYEELRCTQDSSCSCQTFMANKTIPDKWSCWGSGPPESCPAGSPTSSLVGQMCNPRDPLPQNPNPPPAVCPATWEESLNRQCDGRIQECTYGYHEFGCNGATRCVPTHQCNCFGQWYCAELTHYCPLQEGVPVTPFRTCTP
ncbi:MAG: hypothetical protein SGILL_000773 [Bacillariaceae sp.]